MPTPVEYIKQNQKYKYWTLYTDKDKRVASHDDDDDPATAFEQMYGFLTAGSYRLLIRKTDRADRGSMSLNFKKDEENYPSNMGFQQTQNGSMSPFELGIKLGRIEAEQHRIDVEQQRQRVLMDRLEKVLPLMEKLAENQEGVVKVLLDLNDDDDDNDDNALDRVSDFMPKISNIVSSVRSMSK